MQGDTQGTSQPNVVIIIVGFRNLDDIVQCLSALDKQDYRSFDIVICENGGQEAFEKLRNEVPSRLSGGQLVSCIADNSNPGYAGAINRCIDVRPGAELYWILNPDTIAQPHALSRMVNCLQAGDYDAIGATIFGSDDRILTRGGGQWFKRLAYARNFGFGASVHTTAPKTEVEPDLSYISGASLLFSQRFLQRAGKMNEDYFLYAEEVEWCLRAKARGLRLGYCPDAYIAHLGGSTTGSGEDPRRRPKLSIYLDHRNRLLTVRDTTPTSLPIAAVAVFVLLTKRFLLKGAWRQWIYALQGLSAGLRNERGKPKWLGG